MGSNDRKICRELVYNYYRLGCALPHSETETRVAIGNFLFSFNQGEMMNYLLSTYLNLSPDHLTDDYQKKINLIKEKFPDWCLNDIFPLIVHVSESINHIEWLHSFFYKPLVWVRALKNKTGEVMQAFDNAGLRYIRSPFTDEAFGFDASEKITETKAYKNGLVEIQDISSQRLQHFFKPAVPNEKWWDCCAGAGGKSLLLCDHYPNIDLTVSDIRESVMLNLNQRMKRAGSGPVKSKLVDLSEKIKFAERFDTILLDAPCSGSGTWNRTPERLRNFSEAEIDSYAKRQKFILANVISSVKPGGRIIYITCSVFKAENEGVIEFVTSRNEISIESMQFIDGYHQRGDTLFVAVLRMGKTA